MAIVSQEPCLGLGWREGLHNESSGLENSFCLSRHRCGWNCGKDDSPKNFPRPGKFHVVWKGKAFGSFSVLLEGFQTLLDLALNRILLAPFKCGPVSVNQNNNNAADSTHMCSGCQLAHR